jgi:hypothetical protein
MNAQEKTVSVSYRLPMQLVVRLRQATRNSKRAWPPPPSQTALVIEGIELMLRKLERGRARGRED